VLLTAGVQLPLARRCAAAGLPAYALPVPASRFGILENIVTVGALVDRIGPSRALAGSLAAGFDRLLASRGEARPRVYVELWFGRHPRTTGGRTFIHDLVELAGGENVFGSRPEGYLPLDLPAAAAARPEVAIFFSEPEYPVDHERLIAERGWDGPGGPRAIVFHGGARHQHDSRRAVLRDDRRVAGTADTRRWPRAGGFGGRRC